MTYYLDSLTAPEGDEVIAAIEHLTTLTGGNEKTYQYLIWLCTRKYQKPAIMGLDKVLVHLYDAHYAAGKMDGWANEKAEKELEGVCGQDEVEPYRQHGTRDRPQRYQ